MTNDISLSTGARRFRRGLLPLSADPVTNGHLNLIERAADLCDELVVLACDNDTKRGKYLFDRATRRKLLERAVRRLGRRNITVRDSDHLLVDEFLEEGADVLFRGIRDDKDREEEARQMRYHDLILPGFASKVVYLEAEPHLREVSSTVVKAFASHGIDISPYVPSFVKAAVEEAICGQWKIGITGEMASGKTWVTQELAKELVSRDYEVAVINFDQLVRDLYVEDSKGAQMVRDELARQLDSDVLTADRKAVNRPELARRLFSPETSSDVRQAIHELTAPHVMRLYRAALKSARGVVLIEWAQLAEMHLGSLVNHRAIVVESPDRTTQLAARSITATQAKNVAAFQWSADRKIAALTGAAEQAGSGMILHYENRRVMAGEKNIPLIALADELVTHIPLTFARKN